MQAAVKLPEATRKIKIVVYFDTRGDVYFCNRDTQQQRLSPLPSPPHGLLILNVIGRWSGGFNRWSFVYLYILTGLKGPWWYESNLLCLSVNIQDLVDVAGCGLGHQHWVDFFDVSQSPGLNSGPKLTDLSKATLDFLDLQIRNNQICQSCAGVSIPTSSQKDFKYFSVSSFSFLFPHSSISGLSLSFTK